MKNENDNIYTPPESTVFEVAFGLVVVAGIVYGLYRVLRTTSSPQSGTVIQEAVSDTVKSTLSTADIAELLRR